MQENSTNTKKVFFSGVLYSAMAKYSSMIVNIVVAAILSRLLTPDNFGVVVIATMFMNFFTSLVTVGISPAIIQNKELEEEDYRGINSVVWILALVLSSTFFISVPLIVSFFDNNEELYDILCWLSFCIFFSVATIVPNALLMKDKQFKVVTLRTIIVNLSAGVVSVLYALNGGGVYALLVTPILGSFLILVINFICRPVGFSCIFLPFKKIISFASKQMLFNFIYILYREVDKFCIGDVLGTKAIGYYEKSYSIMLMPITNVSSILSPVLHPILSDYQKDESYIRNAYLKMLRIFSEVGFVISFLFFAFADVLILTLFGDQWLPSVPVFQVLSLSIAFQLMQTPIGAVMQSINKLNSLVYGALVVLLSLIVCISVGLFFKSLLLTAIMITISYIIGFCGYNYFVCKSLNMSSIDIFNMIFKPLSLFLFIICQLLVVKYFFDYGTIGLLLCNVAIVLINLVVLYYIHALPELENICKQVISKLKKKNV